MSDDANPSPSSASLADAAQSASAPIEAAPATIEAGAVPTIGDTWRGGVVFGVRHVRDVGTFVQIGGPASDWLAA